VPVRRLGGTQFGADRAPNELRDRDPKTLRALLQGSMFIGFELDLNSHHDGMMIPSLCPTIRSDLSSFAAH
jgi:hypothetical protein